MKTIYILFLGLPSLTFAQIEVDFYLDCEAGGNGATLTAAMLEAATHVSGSFPSGNWSVAGINMGVSSGFEVPLIGPVKVGATIYDDVGSTRGFVCEDLIDNHYAEYDFSPNYRGDLSFGCWWSSPDDDGKYVTIDHLIFNEHSGKWAAMQSFLNEVWIHNDTGNGQVITFAYDTAYWVTMDIVPGGTCTLELYNTAGVLVGRSTKAMSGSTLRNFRFGRSDAHNGATGGFIKFDDMIMDTTDQTFPLLPTAIEGVAPAPPTNLRINPSES